MWWNKKQKRQAAPYSDAILAQILEASGQSAINAQAKLQTGAAEIAAGLLSRSLASAELEGTGSETITASLLGTVGRDLVLRGESVWMRAGLDASAWIRAASHEVVSGDPDPASWRYRLTFSVPNGNPRIFTATGGLVLHFRWASHPNTPWVGEGPLSKALSASILGNVETRLNQESQAVSAYILPVPTDGQDDSIKDLRKDIQSANGKVITLETTAGGWGDGTASAPRQDYVIRRVGMAPPAEMATLHTNLERSTLALCGVPIELVAPSDGTGQREGWRRYLHSVLQPVAYMMEDELAKAGIAGVMSFDRLMASDLTGRARAFGSLVQGGMDIEQAAGLSGLVQGDE